MHSCMMCIFMYYCMHACMHACTGVYMYLHQNPTRNESMSQSINQSVHSICTVSYGKYDRLSNIRSFRIVHTLVVFRCVIPSFLVVDLTRPDWIELFRLNVAWQTVDGGN
eukprot:243512_1